MKKCALCESAARLHCVSDEASLCWDCDSRVHSANFIVSKHTRTLLCHSCQSPTPWTGSGSKLDPTFSVCEICFTRNAHENRDLANRSSHNDDDDDSDGNHEYQEEEEEEEEEEEGAEDDDAENQVVPLSPLSTSLASSSSNSGDSSSKRDESWGSYFRFSTTNPTNEDFRFSDNDMESAEDKTSTRPWTWR